MNRSCIISTSARPRSSFGSGHRLGLLCYASRAIGSVSKLEVGVEEALAEYSTRFVLVND